MLNVGTQQAVSFALFVFRAGKPQWDGCPLSGRGGEQCNGGLEQLAGVNNFLQEILLAGCTSSFCFPSVFSCVLPP